MKEQMKVHELRGRYEQGEVQILQTTTPRSGKELHGWQESDKDFRIRKAKGEVEKNKAGMPVTESYTTEEVVWELPLDKKVHALTDNKGETELYVKNVMVEVNQ